MGGRGSNWFFGERWLIWILFLVFIVILLDDPH